MSSTDKHNMPFQGIRTNPADNRSSMTFSASVTMPFVWSFLTCQTQAEPLKSGWERISYRSVTVYSAGKTDCAVGLPAQNGWWQEEQRHQRHGADPHGLPADSPLGPPFPRGAHLQVARVGADPCGLPADWPAWTPRWLPAGTPFPEGCPSPGRQGRCWPVWTPCWDPLSQGVPISRLPGSLGPHSSWLLPLGGFPGPNRTRLTQRCLMKSRPLSPGRTHS